MTDKRVYKSIYRNTKNGAELSKWRLRLSQMMMSGRPVFMIKIDTTGLDPAKDDLLGIVILKAEFKSSKLVAIDEFKSLINPGRILAPVETQYNGLTNELLATAPNLKEVMTKAMAFIGENAQIIGCNIGSFLGPFLTAAANKSNTKLSLAMALDMLHMGRAVLSSEKYGEKYGYYHIAERLGVENIASMEGFLETFNRLLELSPRGTESVKVTGAKYWEKAYNRRYIFVETTCGTVTLNCTTGYFEESMPGFFDTVDMDQLTEYILNKRNCNSIFDFIKLYIPTYTR